MKHGWLGVLVLAQALLGCSPDTSTHDEIVKNINGSTKYKLYKDFSSKPIREGVIGTPFFGCLRKAENDWNPGSTQGAYSLELELELEAKHKLSFYTLKVHNNNIEHVSVWIKRTKHGNIGSSYVLKLDCPLSRLK